MRGEKEFLEAFHHVLGATFRAQQATAACTKALAELGDAWRGWFKAFESMMGGKKEPPPWLMNWEASVDKKGGEE